MVYGVGLVELLHLDPAPTHIRSETQAVAATVTATAATA
jgi:hypothetical protein